MEQFLAARQHVPCGFLPVRPFGSWLLPPRVCNRRLSRSCWIRNCEAKVSFYLTVLSGLLLAETRRSRLPVVATAIVCFSCSGNGRLRGTIITWAEQCSQLWPRTTGLQLEASARPRSCCPSDSLPGRWGNALKKSSLSHNPGGIQLWHPDDGITTR